MLSVYHNKLKLTLKHLVYFWKRTKQQDNKTLFTLLHVKMWRILHNLSEEWILGWLTRVKIGFSSESWQREEGIRIRRGTEIFFSFDRKTKLYLKMSLLYKASSMSTSFDTSQDFLICSYVCVIKNPVLVPSTMSNGSTFPHFFITVHTFLCLLSIITT